MSKLGGRYFDNLYLPIVDRMVIFLDEHPELKSFTEVWTALDSNFKVPAYFRMLAVCRSNFYDNLLEIVYGEAK